MLTFSGDRGQANAENDINSNRKVTLGFDGYDEMKSSATFLSQVWPSI